MTEEIQPKFTDTNSLCWDSVTNGKNLFILQQSGPAPQFYESLKLKMNVKINNEYREAQKELAKQNPQSGDIAAQIHQSNQQQINYTQPTKLEKVEEKPHIPQQQQIQPIQQKTQYEKILDELPREQADKISKLPKQFLNFQSQTASNPITENTYIPNDNITKQTTAKGRELVAFDKNPQNKQLQIVDPARLGTVLANKVKKVIRPDWHRPWKLMKVISGHHGWVRCLSVDPSNQVINQNPQIFQQFFVSGSSDRTIKFWDLATGTLKLTYTGHISAVRGVIVSPRHPYLFSCAEDKTVKCWDLEQNKIIRDYHGHLSGVYCMTMHPTLDLIATGGRDSVVRLWDIRSRQQIHVFEGHTGTVDSLISSEIEPQLVSGSQDAMIKTWDIVSGKCFQSLTNHKKSIRAMAFHPIEYSFCSAAPDNIKIWKCPEAIFLRNLAGHNGIINTVAVNKDNVLISGADNGSLYFWDWKSGYNFQKIQTIPQPGSISAENGIFCSTFDQSHLRYITGECDKSIKIYKEDENATPETHPIEDFKIEFQSQRF